MAERFIRVMLSSAIVFVAYFTSVILRIAIICEFNNPTALLTKKLDFYNATAVVTLADRYRLELQKHRW